MSDRLYLSYWIRGFTEHNMLRHWEKMLRRFPFSRLLPRAELRVYAIEMVEPPVVVSEFAGTIPIEEILAAASESQHADCAYLLDTAWDIWQFEQEWKLLPARVTLSCFGPMFPSDLGEQLLIDFGPDQPFLPSGDHGGNIAPVRHNIRALLHLVGDLGEGLAVARRKLWSESGENFAERLEATLAER